MFSVRTPLILRIFDGRFVTCSVPTKEKVIYLTFDDGPIPEVTPDVLNILKENKIKATFFSVGDNVKKHPDVFASLIAEGHAIGNHTFHHLNGWKTPPAEYLDDVNHCNELLNTKLFRPPYGKVTPSQYFLLRKKYKIILWSALSGDYHAGISKEQCLSNVIESTGPGSIVVFHDSLKAKENLFYTLPRFIDHFLDKGF
ncbi:MAG: polysaccharide deacetylase family protein, partial [Bacteroidales bacterium]